MANAITIKTPEMGHRHAYAIGTDAANRQMRKAGRTVWNEDDYNVFAATTQEWYAHFNILNAHQWMPEGYAWRKVDGEYRPVKL